MASPSLVPAAVPCRPNTYCITSPAALLPLPVRSMAADTCPMAWNTVIEPSDSCWDIFCPSMPNLPSASLVWLVISRMFLMPITMAFMFWSVKMPPSELWMMATSCEAEMPASRNEGAYCCIMESSFGPSPCIMPCMPSRMSCIDCDPVCPNWVISVLAALMTSRKSTP